MHENRIRERVKNTLIIMFCHSMILFIVLVASDPKMLIYDDG